MSRTIRRKGMKRPTGWYSIDRETFDIKRAVYISDEWRGTYQYFSAHQNQLVTCIRKWYNSDVAQHSSYEALIASKEAIFHSDAGYPVDNNTVCASFRRTLNRCFRAKHNHQLQCAIIREEEEDLLLNPFIRDASWWF